MRKTDADFFERMQYPVLKYSDGRANPAVVFLMKRDGKLWAVNPAYLDPFDPMPREYEVSQTMRRDPLGALRFKGGYIADTGQLHGYNPAIDWWREQMRARYRNIRKGAEKEAVNLGGVLVATIK